MKSANIQIREVSNKIFLDELQNRLKENKIKENQLAKILTELVFNQDEQNLSSAYEE
jgi:EAL domain-containing protein (putative c-di-GMP-specific phosphodiesterase class I)